MDLGIEVYWFYNDNMRDIVFYYRNFLLEKYLLQRSTFNRKSLIKKFLIFNFLNLYLKSSAICILS